MTQPDVYLLGRGPAEEERLKRQIADLAPVSDAQLVKIGIRPGERVVDLGCGPGGILHLLGKHVGPSGWVLGIDRSAHFVDLARRFAVDLGLTQVEVERRSQEWRGRTPCSPRGRRCSRPRRRRARKLPGRRPSLRGGGG